MVSCLLVIRPETRLDLISRGQLQAQRAIVPATVPVSVGVGEERRTRRGKRWRRNSRKKWPYRRPRRTPYSPSKNTVLHQISTGFVV